MKRSSKAIPAAGQVLRGMALPLLLLFCGMAQGQHNWNWVFGERVLMHFPGGGSPVVDTVVDTKVCDEAVTAWSDSAGNLLFYVTDEGIFEPDGTMAPSGDLLDCSYSTTQGVIVLPCDETDTSFYVFYLTGAVDSAVYGLRFSRFSVSSITGEFQIEIKDSLIFDSMKALQERMVAVKHGNGTDWWLLLHDLNYFYGGGRHIVKYLVTSTAIQGPFLELVGTAPFEEYYGQTATSTKGDALALVAPGKIDYYKFDRCAGAFSFEGNLSDACINLEGENTFYGCSFSPDGTRLYASEGANINEGGCRLFQFDITATDIKSSKVLIYQTPADTTQILQHQLGPDGRIYISISSGFINPDNPRNFHLSYIDQPNNLGTACNFVENGIYLEGKRVGLGLGNFPNYNLGPLGAQPANAGPDYTACPGDTVWIGVGGSKAPEVENVWTASNGTAWIGDAMGMQTPVTVTQNTTFYFTVTDITLSDCAVTQDSMTVTVVAPQFVPNANAGSDEVRCYGYSDSLTLGSPDFSAGNWSYTWTILGGGGLDTTSQITVHPAGTVSYLLTVDHETAVCTASSDTVTVTVELPVSLTPMQGGEICLGDSFAIGNPGFPWLTYDWTPGDGLGDSTEAQTMAAPNATTLYILTATDTNLVTTCRSASETMTVTVKECGEPLALPTSIGAGQTLQIGGLASPVNLTVWDMRGRLIYQSSDYRNDLRAEQLSEGVYGYLVRDGVVEAVRKLVVVW